VTHPLIVETIGAVPEIAGADLAMEDVMIIEFITVTATLPLLRRFSDVY